MARTKGTIGKCPSLVDRNRSEIHPICDISYGIDMRNRCAGIGIYFDASSLSADSCLFKGQILKPRATPCCHENTTTGSRGSIGQLGKERTGFALDRGDRLTKHHINPATPHPFQHRSGQFGIKSPQQPWPTHHLRYRNTESSQDASKFASNETGTHHHDRGGNIFKLKHVITDPGLLNPRNLRTHRPTTHGDKQAGSKHLTDQCSAALFRDTNAVWSCEPTPPRDQRHTSFL